MAVKSHTIDACLIWGSARVFGKEIVLHPHRGETISSPRCLTDMCEKQKLRQDLERHRAVLRLMTDRRAVAALRELIQRTRDRLKQIRNRAEMQARKVDD